MFAKREHLKMQTLICVLYLLLNINPFCSCPTTTISCEPCRCYLTQEGVKADCSKKRLTHVPETIPKSTTFLDMTSNTLVDLPDRSFLKLTKLRLLDLSFNNITSMSVNAFSGLHTLETLILHGNNLSLQHTTYPCGLFGDLGHLVTLDISKNHKSKSIQASYPDRTLSQLLSLKNLLMDGLENATLGKGFSSLRNLTNLTMSGHKGYCLIFQLLNDTFIHVPWLQYLDISNCEIENVSPGSFQPMKNINTLDISNNKRLGLNNFGKSLYGLRHSKIQIIRANEVEPTFAIGVYVYASYFLHLNNTGLRELYVDSNRIELIHPLVPVTLQSLEVLSMRYNRITFGLFLFSLDPMVNLTVLDASSQYQSNILPFHSKRWGATRSVWSSMLQRRESNIHLSTDVSRDNPIKSLSGDTKHGYKRLNTTFQNNERRMRETRSNPYDRRLVETNVGFTLTIPIPPNLTVFNTSHSKMSYELYELIFSQNNVKILDMSYNLFTKWIGPLRPLDKLEKMFLSNNYCTEIGPLFLKYAYNLKILDISKNFLAFSMGNDSEGLILKRQGLLESLNISNNFIDNLPNNIFESLNSLSVLDLSWNSMSKWDINITHMSNLRFLNLSHNRFEIIPEKLRQEIDLIMSSSKNDSFHININGNILKCECRTLESLEWMMNTYLTIDDDNDSRCDLADGKTMTLDQRQSIIRDLRKKCKTPLPLIFGSLAGIVVFLVILVGGIVHRYRWNLRYLYYTTKRKYRGYKRLTEDDNFTYDAFVSHADEDRGFVVNDMRLNLEERFGLKLCIHHRDFLVGNAITANITKAVQTSRKTIAVLSPSFVRSSWCDYEVHMAKLESIHTGRDVLCVVRYKDVPVRDTPADLLEQMATGTYIMHTEDVDGEELFWASLRDAIKH